MKQGRSPKAEVRKEEEESWEQVASWVADELMFLAAFWVKNEALKQRLLECRGRLEDKLEREESR